MRESFTATESRAAVSEAVGQIRSDQIQVRNDRVSPSRRTSSLVYGLNNVVLRNAKIYTVHVEGRARAPLRSQYEHLPVAPPNPHGAILPRAFQQAGESLPRFGISELFHFRASMSATPAADATRARSRSNVKSGARCSSAQATR